MFFWVFFFFTFWRTVENYDPFMLYLGMDPHVLSLSFHKLYVFEHITL